MTVGEVGRTLYSEGGVQVIEIDRGRTAILRMIGTCTPALVEWMFHALRGYRGAVLVNARELASIDAPFVQRILDHAARKHPIGLLSPPAALIEILEQLVAPTSSRSSAARRRSFPTDRSPTPSPTRRWRSRSWSPDSGSIRSGDAWTGNTRGSARFAASRSRTCGSGPGPAPARRRSAMSSATC